jgi:IclR family transcriptional regulator, pca regulon regulatory protein
VPVRDGAGAVRAAMNVTVHSAETSVADLIERHLPPLRAAASAVSAEWAAWHARPQEEDDRTATRTLVR